MVQPSNGTNKPNGTTESPKDGDEVQLAIAELRGGLEALEKKAQQFKKSLTDDYKQLDELVSDISKKQKQLASTEKLHQRQKGPDESRALSDLRRGFARLKQSYTPETGSLFVRFFLGQVNVKQYRDGERLRLKQEYEKFKQRTNPLFIAFVMLLYYYPYSALIVSWQVWLLYYYVTLALRENILRVNGSSIKRWWIVHHYLSIEASLIMLLWPVDEAFLHFFPRVLWFSFAQGCVQVLINRYQHGQLYKLVAMGKANIMDVAGESEGWIDDPGWTPSAMFLLPFLLAVQTLQLTTGLHLSAYAFQYGAYDNWQVTASGLTFLCLAAGNLYTTLRTYYQKYSKFRGGAKVE